MTAEGIKDVSYVSMCLFFFPLPLCYQKKRHAMLFPEMEILKGEHSLSQSLPARVTFEK